MKLPIFEVRLPRPTIRLRLTLTYSALFLVVGAGLLSVSFFVFRSHEQSVRTSLSVICSNRTALGDLGGLVAPGTQNGGQVVSGSASGSASSAQSCQEVVQQATQGSQSASGSARSSPVTVPPGTPGGPGLSVRQLVSTVRASQSDAVTTLLIGSAIALGVMSVISLALGWWIAGRVLRPVHRITDTARRLSEQTLHNRINLEGPRDELKELADTFDAMLARLDQAFTSQRRFVANASHELRTPLATERVLIDEALAGRASPQEMRAILEQLRTNSVETEQLIDALLILARSGRDIEQWSAVDLAEIGDTASERASIEAAAAAIDVQTDLDPAPVVGEPGLLERLTGNLVENGIRHNQPGGWVTITTATAGDQAYVEVANSGPVVDPAATAGLIEPFRRSGADRSSRDGFGLGLSIVHAIVSAHGGQIGITARPEGGLVVRASFPVAARV